MHSQLSSISNTRRISGNILVIFSSLMLLGSAFAKLEHVPKVVSNMGALGFDGNKLMLIAVLEIVCAVLFLIPVTRSFGLLMVSAYIGGAMATHVGHDHPAFQPALVLVIIWLATWLRHPQILWSFQPYLAGKRLAQQESRQTILGQV